MKKLLSLLAVCSFGVATSTSVVACSKKPEVPKQETDPKEVIAKSNKDFAKRVEQKEFVVHNHDARQIQQELEKQIKELITILIGDNKELKFDLNEIQLNEKDELFNINYTISVEKESKKLSSETFLIEKQTYIFRTQLDDVNEEFNKILLDHHFIEQDISDIDTSNVNILQIILKIISVETKIQTEIADIFKELNLENIEIKDPKIHLILDEEDILLANPDLNKILEGNINLPAFVKYSLKENNNNKVFLSEKLLFSFKIPKIDITELNLKTNNRINKNKLNNQTFSSINLDKVNEDFSKSLVAHAFEYNIEEINTSDLLAILQEVLSIIENINSEITTEFNELKLDNVNLGNSSKIALNINIADIISENKWSIFPPNTDQIIKDIKEKGIILPFVASYTLNDKTYFADNLKAKIKINLPI